MITLTGNSGSELAGLSDEAIIVVTEEGLFRAESLASRISYLTVMDILYTNTMYHNFDQNADSLKKSVITLAQLRPIRIICRKEKVLFVSSCFCSHPLSFLSLEQKSKMIDVPGFSFEVLILCFLSATTQDLYFLSLRTVSLESSRYRLL